MMEETLVSVCMPYWNRAEALRLTMENFAHLYGERYGQRMELSICDDGSTREPLIDCALLEWTGGEFRTTETQRQKHETPGNSAAAIASALKRATGEVLILQNPETTHACDVVTPIIETVLDGMAEDRQLYVICACYDPDLKMWYEHSERRRKGMHWCVGAHRSLWMKALEGFPPDWLMQGVCYEDNLLRNRIMEAGGELTWRDDLLVHHYKGRQEKVPGRKMHDDRWDPQLTRLNQKVYLSIYTPEWRQKTLAPLKITGE